jgi:hypothetical protein
MGNSLSQQGYGNARSELNDIGVQRAGMDREAALDATQTGLGVAGIVDPTGIADGANAAISWTRGDYFGFVLDGASAVPYAGDAVAKPIRGIQMGIRSWLRGSKIAGLAQRGAKLVESMRAMRQRAADAVKQARRQNCKRCNNKYGSMTPKRGQWENPADPGNGKYTVDGNTYQFKDGYPDFEHPDMQKYLADGKSSASIEMTGNRATDDRLANAATGRADTPDGYTWHHGDDGTTMYLVDSTHHDAIIPHDGGHSIAADPVF